MFPWVIGFSYMLTFIDGAKITGIRMAAHTIVVSRSSATPAATLPNTFAVAGATRNREARSTREIWPISCSWVR